ncbi:MAG: hypothetical protein JSU68_01930 [Phycisphaerales bacterium]|nr:MAG: hypothetical protein JSU68_01930 [Phycisphaerales bacterium]
MNPHRRRYTPLWFMAGLAALLVSQSASSVGAPGENEDLDAVLDRLERAGDNVHDIRSSLVFETFNTVLEDRIIKTGLLLYKKQKPNAMFLVRFDRIHQGGVSSESREWHLFDGRWYTEARQTTRQVIKREIVREGEQINPFELGKGPFPLPFGQKKSELVKLFDIELEPPVAGDPPKTTHLRCEPKVGTEMADKYKILHLFVSDALDLPIRIVAEQTDENIVTVIFEKLEINPAVAGSEFRLPSDTEDWDVEVEPLPPATGP